MTRFVRVNIDLRHLDSEFLMRVPDFESCDSADIDVPIGTVFKTHWGTRDGRALATSVSADITLPQAVGLPNSEIGTSVFAAGHVGLELVRISLARVGLPKHLLDRICGNHVSVLNVSVSYLLRLQDERSVQSFKRLIRQHGTLLGLQITTFHANSQTEYREPLTSALAEAQSPMSALSGAAVSIDFRPTKSFVCIDALLNENYLKRQGWTDLAGWDIKYAGNRYEVIFNMAVRGILRLDEPSPDYPEPNENALVQLGPRHEQLMRAYLTGADPKLFDGFPAKLPNLAISREKGWKVAQKAILEQTGIDIKAPWKNYQQGHRPRLLMEQLIYPGDYAPPNAAIASHFCAENWPSILDSLRRKYDGI